MHRNSQLLFESRALRWFEPGQRVLEIGPSGFPSQYRTAVERAGVMPAAWDTLDIDDDPRLTYPGSDGYAFAIEDGAYDLVLSGQVLEHVPRIWRWMAELARVTRTGGIVITINPVSWPYHTAPVDCWRAYPDGMRALYDDAGLDVIESVCESLETVGRRGRRIPGKGLDCQGRLRKAAFGVLGLVGFPIECAYDTITIGRRRPAAEQAPPLLRLAA